MIRQLVGIYLAGKAGDSLCEAQSVRCIAGRGLEGDRYCTGKGSYSRWPRPERAVSLIEQETIDAVRLEHGIDVGQGRSRRNLVTTGVRLEELRGKRFRIGTAVFLGGGPCAPCRYLERLLGPGTFDALAGRGGLRAEVVEKGVITVGDVVEILSREPTVIGLQDS
jgi:MOSC domain-containing protein YiiM